MTRLRLLVIIAGLAMPGSLSLLTPHEAVAAPAMRPLLAVAASPSDANIVSVYYYHGRYYRYRYGGRYYAHRYQRGNGYRYY